MRITILQGPFLPVPPIYGGAVEKIWFSMGKEFCKLGHDVIHISKREQSHPLKEVIDGVTHLRIKGFKAPRNFALGKLFDLIYSLRASSILPPADFLFTNTFFMPILPTKQGKGKLIASVERMPRGQLRFYRKSVYFRANSTPVLKAIQREVPAAISRIFLVPNPLPSTLNLKKNWGNKEKTILYVGRIHPEKGIDILAEAFELVTNKWRHDFKLRIIGPSLISQGGAGKNYQLSLSRRFSRTNKIEWVGPIFNERLLAEEYQKASLFVYPSIAEKGETFGLAPLEAMSHACACITSDLDCFKDFLHHRVNGFIFNHRHNPVENLADLLKEILLEMPTEDLDSIRNNAVNVRISHSVEKVAYDFIEVLKSK